MNPVRSAKAICANTAFVKFDYLAWFIHDIFYKAIYTCLELITFYTHAHSLSEKLDQN